MMTFLFNDNSTLAAAHNEKLRAFDQFQPGTNFKAWLFTILRNAFMHEKPTPIKESRGRVRQAVAIVVMLLMFVLFGRPAVAQIDLSENIDITQPLFSVNMLYFRAGNGAKTLTEVFVEIPYSNLTFVKSGAGYKAKVEARVVFDDASGFQVDGNTITDTIRANDFQATLSSSRKNLFYFSFQIVPGRYSLRISVIDEYTGGRKERAHNISVPSFQDSLLQISSLKLARDVDMFRTGSTLQKSGRDLAPNVPHLFASHLPYFVYFEAYHLEPAAPQADSFQVYCRILQNGKEMCSSIRHYPKPDTHVGITAKLNLRNLKPGIYALKVTVTDQNGKRRADKVALFYIIDSLYEFSNNQLKI